MRTLIYKRTHNGDPDPDTGVFGCNECMKSVRGWPFDPEDAVIGVGGIGSEPQQEGIARKLTWVGIGPQKAGMGKDGHPLLTFKHFLYYGGTGPSLNDVAPALAKRIYDGGVRLIWDTSLSKEEERKDVEKILDLAKDALPSGRFAGMPLLDAKKASGESRSTSCCRSSAASKAEQSAPVDRSCRRGG